MSIPFKIFSVIFVFVLKLYSLLFRNGNTGQVWRMIVECQLAVKDRRQVNVDGVVIF